MRKVSKDLEEGRWARVVPLSVNSYSAQTRAELLSQGKRKGQTEKDFHHSLNYGSYFIFNRRSSVDVDRYWSVGNDTRVECNPNTRLINP